MSLVSRVTMDRVFVALASNPADFVVCGSAGSVGGGGQRDDNITQEGEFRNYANFVTRLVLGTAQIRTQTFALRALSPTQVRQIISWIGKTVLFRDAYGRRIFGSYIVVDMTDIPLSGTPNGTLQTDIAIVLQSVTYSEGV